MKRAGSTKKPSPNRITLLRDADGDGVAEIKRTFLAGLNSPFGMALVGDAFYVADTDALLRFRYDGENVSQAGEKVADLPGGPINHHWTKNVIASEDGKKLYVTVGSNSNVGENGLDKEKDRAAILEIDADTGKSRVFASGLRNPNGLGWQPQSKQLWTVVNERDELGNDVAPDYLTSVKDGGFYGWPYSYFGQHLDARVKEQRPDLVAKAIVPDYALGAHTASLGLAFYDGKLLPRAFPGRRLHRSARLVEPRAALGLQGNIRAVQGRPAIRAARGHPHRLRRRRRQCAGPPGGRGHRQEGRAARGGRRGQHHLARSTCLT